MDKKKVFDNAPKYSVFMLLAGVITYFFFEGNSVIGLLYPFIGGIFIALLYLRKGFDVITGISIYFLAVSLFTEPKFGGAALILIIPYCITGFFMRRSRDYATPFLVGVLALSAAFIGVILLSQEYGEFSLLNEIEGFNKEVVNMILELDSSFNRAEVEKNLKLAINFMPAAIVISSMILMLLNITISRKIIRTIQKKEKNLPFMTFSMPSGIFIPMIAVLIASTFQSSYTSFVSLISDNLIVIFQMLIAVQGLAVAFYLSRNVKGAMNFIIKILLVLGFIYGSAAFSVLGMIDLIFNLRRFERRG